MLKTAVIVIPAILMLPLAGATLAQGLGGGAASNVPEGRAPAAAPAEDIEPEQLFATSCGWCHQQGGRAAGRGPKLAGMEKSDEFIIERIKRGKPGTMPAFGKSFSDSQIAAIVAYIRLLDQ
jgi:mono/diheme cytochrome c family protein